LKRYKIREVSFLNPEELYVFENENMLQACKRLCKREPTANCPEWCIIKIVDSNFSFHMEMKWYGIAEDYAYMLQKEDVLRTAQRRLSCTHNWHELQGGGRKCPICGAIYLVKKKEGGSNK
jgi:hypothetical protein